MFIHILCMYSCSWELMAAQTNMWEKRKNTDRKRRDCKRAPAKEQYLNYFWVRIVERNGFPKLNSFMSFYIKECNLTLTKGSPHKLEITVVPLRNWFESHAVAAIQASVIFFSPNRKRIVFMFYVKGFFRFRNMFLFYVYFFPLPDDVFWGRNYRFYILRIPSWFIYIYIFKIAIGGGTPHVQTTPYYFAS